MLTRALAWWVSFHFQEKPVPRTSSPELARQWRERIHRFEHSELTVAEFCQLEGYSVASVYQWRRRLADDPGDDPGDNQKNAFVHVELSPTALAMPGLNRSDQGTDLRIELPGGGLLRLDADATDQQQCRLIKNVIRSLMEVA
jgi:hypothetical protein